MSLAAEAFLGRPNPHHARTWVAAENRLALNTRIRLYQHARATLRSKILIAQQRGYCLLDACSKPGPISIAKSA
jgi:hypothetical protein